jgi:hypothetical protein
MRAIEAYRFFIMPFAYQREANAISLRRECNWRFPRSIAATVVG